MESRRHSSGERAWAWTVTPTGSTTEEGRPVVSFAYVTRAAAEEAAAQIQSAVENAVEVRAHPLPEMTDFA